jgi:hypothetical protein
MNLTLEQSMKFTRLFAARALNNGYTPEDYAFVADVTGHVSTAATEELKYDDMLAVGLSLQMHAQNRFAGVV